MSQIFKPDLTNSFIYCPRNSLSPEFCDGKNRLESVKDPEGNLTTYGYASGGACTTCGSGAGAFTTPTSINDPFNKVTTNTLDSLGRIEEIKDPLNYVTAIKYDRVGRVTTRKDAELNSTDYEYDKLGRIKTQTDANTGVTRFTYDTKGNLLTLTDPENNTTTFKYDKAGRMRNPFLLDSESGFDWTVNPESTGHPIRF